MADQTQTAFGEAIARAKHAQDVGRRIAETLAAETAARAAAEPPAEPPR